MNEIPGSESAPTVAESAPAVASSAPEVVAARARGPWGGILRIGAWAGILLFLFVGAASALAFYLLDEDLLKAELSRALGREVDFTRVKPGFLVFKVEGLVVGDLPGYEPDPLLEAQRLDLSYSLLSLFRGKLEVTSLVLSAARLALETRGDGESNFADLASADDEGGIIEVRTVRFDGVDLRFARDSEVVLVTGIRGIVDGLAEPVHSFEVTARAFNADIAAKGVLDPASPSGRMSLGVEGLDLDALQLSTPGVDLSGLIARADGELSFSSETVAWKGGISLPGFAEFDLDAVAPLDHPESAAGVVAVTAVAEKLGRIAELKPYIAEYQPAGSLRVTLPFQGIPKGVPDRLSAEFLGFGAREPKLGRRIEEIRGGASLAGNELTLRGLTARIEGAPVSATGRIDIKTMHGELDVEAKSFDVSTAVRMLPEGTVPAGAQVSGPLSVKASVTLAKEVTVKGRGIFEGLRIALAPPLVRSPSAFEDIRGAAEFTGDEIRFEKLSLKHDGAPLEISGTYNLRRETVDLAVTGTSIDLGAVASLSPEPVLPAGMSLAGKASLDIKAKGKAKDPEVNGWVSLENLTAGLAEPKTDVREITGRLELEGRSVRLKDVTARTNSMAIRVGGVYDRAKETVDLEIAAEEVNLALLPADLGTDLLAVAGTAAFKGKAKGKASSPVVTGAITSEGVDLFGTRLSNVAALVAWDSPTVSAEKITAGFLGGTLTGRASMNVMSQASPFLLELGGEGMSFPEAIALGTRMAGAPYEGLTSGVASGRISISGDDFARKETFSGKGSAEVKSVDLGSLKLIASITRILGAGELRGVGGLVNFLSGSDVKRFQDIRGSFTIDNGRLNVSEAIRLRGVGDYAIRFRGGVGLDGTLSGLTAEVELPSSWFSSTAANIAFAAMGGRRSGGKAVLPMELTGTFSEPVPVLFKPDGRALLEGVLGGVGVPTAPTPAPEPAEPTVDPGAGGSAPAESSAQPPVEAPKEAPKPATKEEIIRGVFGEIFGRK